MGLLLPERNKATHNYSKPATGMKFQQMTIASMGFEE
jgi:hypothetical protein